MKVHYLASTNIKGRVLRRIACGSFWGLVPQTLDLDVVTCKSCRRHVAWLKRNKARIGARNGG